MRVIKIIIFCLGFTMISIGSLEAQKTQDKDNSKSRVIYEENTSFEDALYRANKVKEMSLEQEQNNAGANNLIQNQGNGKSSDDFGVRLMSFLQQMMGMGNSEDLYKKMMQGASGEQQEKNTEQSTEEGFKEWGTRHKWGGLEKETR